MPEEGKRIAARWSKKRTRLVEKLGWSDLKDGKIITRALKIAAGEKNRDG